MTTESTFRAIALLNVVVCLPVGLYFRIRSQATREKLDRKEEGVFILVGLRLCLLLAGGVFAAYLIDPALVSWSSLDLPEWLRWVGATLGLLVVPPLLFWTFRAWGRTSRTRSSPGGSTPWSRMVPIAGCVTPSTASSCCGGSR